MIGKMKSILKDRDSQKQFIKYIFVGGSSAVCELGSFTVLRSIVELEISTSNIIATIIATTFNFILNRGWAFNNNSNLSKSMVLYLCLFLINMIFSTWFIGILVNIGVMDFVAKLITMVMVTVWNFVLYKKVVFK